MTFEKHFLWLFILLPMCLSAQTGMTEFRSATHLVTPEEMGMLHESGKGFTPTPPPGGKVRSIAEFEPSEGVIVGYSGQFGIPFNLIAEMAQVAKVYTIVASANAENTVRNQYLANGVDTNKCIFVRGVLDSYWARDYSPWFIADSAHRVAIVDFPYNRNRPNDNNVPGLMATALGLTMYGMNVKHTGGNYMSTGLGAAASTKLVITENTNLTLSQINGYHHDYLGIDPYYTIDDPLGDYIEHIDCWGKFLAPDKILLGQVPSNDPRYQDYEAIATFFATELSAYGTPYKVYRVYSPNGQPYTNSYILNNKVFVPVVTTNGTPWNDSALAAYGRAMPGYSIVGIYALSSKPWSGTDALHCRVHEIADRGMLYIEHTPLSGDIGQQTGYEVRGEIIPYSDSTLYPDSVYVSYRYNTGPWHQATMVPDTGFVWAGMIPDSAYNVTISYAIHAADHSGRSANHPFMGKSDPHHFDVKPNIGIQRETIPKRELLIFPNPCDDKLYAAVPGALGSKVEARMYTIAGKMVVQTAFAHGGEFYKKGIDTRHLDDGIYLLEVIWEGRRSVERVMVIHP